MEFNSGFKGLIPQCIKRLFTFPYDISETGSNPIFRLSLHVQIYSSKYSGYSEEEKSKLCRNIGYCLQIYMMSPTTNIGHPRDGLDVSKYKKYL